MTIPEMDKQHLDLTQTIELGGFGELLSWQSSSSVPVISCNQIQEWLVCQYLPEQCVPPTAESLRGSHPLSLACIAMGLPGANCQETSDIILLPGETHLTHREACLVGW
jgi:hypothetical protein